MLDKVIRAARWEIPDQCSQVVGTVLAFFSVLASMLAILGLVENTTFNWYVLAASIVGLLSPWTYYRRGGARFVPLILAFVAGLLGLALMVDWIF